MQTYRLAVCEDDSIVRTGISRFCEETLTQENIKHEIVEFSSAEELAAALEADPQSFELLILDIFLGEGRNGMDFAKEVCKKDEKTSIIFITGYDGYAQMGYDVQALHFLVKTIVWDKLWEVLLRDCHKRDKEKHVVFQKGCKFPRLPLEEFLYAEADGQHGVRISFTGGMESFPLSLAQIEERAEGQLVRCHNSYLVNMKHVRRLDSKYLLLYNGQKLPVSRTYLKRCREKLIFCLS